MHQANIDAVRNYAYNYVCPDLNRSERRKAYGRMLVAQAEAAAMRAELEYLRGINGIKAEA